MKYIKCVQEEKNKLQQQVPSVTDDGAAAAATAGTNPIDLCNSDNDDDDNTVPVTTITADACSNPGLSIGTVGSIDVERKAKTLKHDILARSGTSNKLSDDQAITLYECLRICVIFIRKKRCGGQDV